MPSGSTYTSSILDSPPQFMNKYDEKYNESIKKQYEALNKLPKSNRPILDQPMVTLKQAREQVKKSRSYRGK